MDYVTVIGGGGGGGGGASVRYLEVYLYNLKDASLDFASVRCPEQRGGEAVASRRLLLY